MPTFGNPSSAASAISLRCSSSVRDSPSSPTPASARRLPRGRREPRVAGAAAPAAGDHDARTGMREVAHERAVLGEHLRADRHRHLERRPCGRSCSTPRRPCRPGCGRAGCTAAPSGRAGRRRRTARRRRRHRRRRRRDRRAGRTSPAGTRSQPSPPRPARRGRSRGQRTFVTGPLRLLGRRDRDDALAVAPAEADDAGDRAYTCGRGRAPCRCRDGTPSRSGGR